MTERHPSASARNTAQVAETAPALHFSVQYGMPETRLPRWKLRRWAEAALRDLHRHDLLPANEVVLTLRLVDAEEGQSLNRDYRERDYATNVLTFEYGIDPDGVAAGDIVLCVPVLDREAVEQGKPWQHHAAHLIIHGVLHALGFDHIEPDEAEAMEAIETRILAGMGIADPYTA